MVKIGGVVYIIVGAIMAFFSNFVQNRTETQSLILFFYLGLIFIAIGVFKVVVKIMLKDKRPKKEKDLSNSMMANLINKDLASVDINKKRDIPQQNNQKQVVSCPRCGTKHFITSNYCHKCGTPLK